MLILIGLGLWDERDLTIRGFETARKADKVYIETYTSKWSGSVKNLEKILEKEIIQLKRKDLEEKANKLIEEAKNSMIAILVSGDPLIATTHSSLLTEARKKGIETKVIHNASIYSAIAETGLHIYKFGASATIPFPERTSEIVPFTTYETLKNNKRKGLHTLLLLDLIVEKKKIMTLNEAMKIMLKTEEAMKKRVFTEDTFIVIFGRAGSENPLIAYGKVKDLINKDFGNPPFVIIVPGKLHFTEKEYLESFRVKK